LDFGLRLFCTLVFLAGSASLSRGSTSESLFRGGNRAYQSGDYLGAVLQLRDSVARRPGSGSLQNLGSAEWQVGRTGHAVLDWEQALWLDPFNSASRGNLRFARRMAQLETPELTWYEVVSTWLPANWWVWIAGASFWLAVGMAALPGLLRRRKAAWQQATAALGLMVFLLSLPAHFGVNTRSRLGFVLEKDTPLRLTPTREGQLITRLAPGSPARCVRVRGNYLLVRTSPQGIQGWLEKNQLGLICP
jgi:hypothetical protein